MKKNIVYLIILVILVLLTMLLPNARAYDFDFSIKGIYSVYHDRDILEDGNGLKGELRWKSIYLWGSWESTELRLTGQRAGGIQLYGFGPGMKIKLVEGLNIFGEIGYYIPDSDMQKDSTIYSEGIRYKWHGICNEINRLDLFPIYNQYEYKLKSGIGGAVGLEFKRELYKNLSFNLFGGYRFLNLKESWYAYPIHVMRGPADFLETKEKRSFSGGQVGIGLMYQFQL